MVDAQHRPRSEAEGLFAAGALWAVRTTTRRVCAWWRSHSDTTLTAAKMRKPAAGRLWKNSSDSEGAVTLLFATLNRRASRRCGSYATLRTNSSMPAAGMAPACRATSRPWRNSTRRGMDDTCMR